MPSIFNSTISQHPVLDRNNKETKKIKKKVQKAHIFKHEQRRKSCMDGIIGT
jgi:hypothetical protein